MKLTKFLFICTFILFFINPCFCLEDIDFSSYIEEIQTKINSKWQPEYNIPLAPILINIIIEKNGNLKSAKIEESSGSKTADDEAIKAVIEASPFAPLPDEYEYETLEIDFKLQTKIIKTTKEKNLAVKKEEWIFVANKIFIDRNSIKLEENQKSAWFSEYFSLGEKSKNGRKVLYELKKATAFCEDKSLKFDSFKYYDEFDKFIQEENLSTEIMAYNLYPKGKFYYRVLCLE